MISTDFILLTVFGFFSYFFLFFLRYYTTFCLVPCLFLSVFFSRTIQEMTGPRIPPTFGEGSLQCSTVELPTDYYLNFCTKRDTKLVNDTQQSVVVVVEPLLLVPCTACRISLLPRPLRIERKSAHPSGLSAVYH